MSSDVLARRFAAVGARVKVPTGPWLGVPQIDVASDRRGEFFDLWFPGRGREVALEVIDVAPADRHLLLLVRDGEVKSKFLCGHDERHWFVAAIPEKALGVTGVASAKAALQPDLVRRAIRLARPKDPFRRRNPAYLRQGEWFFVPAPRINPPAMWIQRDEPLSRGRGKVHVMQFAYRHGGEVVYVSRGSGRVLSAAQFERLPESKRRSGNWSPMTRNPELYAKGTVRHPDHATIVLADWHRVVMNTEQGALAMRHVAFLD